MFRDEQRTAVLIGQGADLQVGKPLLSGSSVSAKVLRQGKTAKVPVVKFRRRQNYLRQGTHRQFFTEVEITGIGGGSSKASADKSEASKPAAKKPAAKKAAPKTKDTAKKETAAKKPAKKKAAKKTGD